MKRSKIIISAVVAVIAIGAVANGVTAYVTGKNLEQRATTVVENLQPLLAQHSGNDLQISIKDYQRGIFSSHFQWQISSRNNPAQPLLVMDQTIHHGPFILSELAQLNLTPTSVIDLQPVTDAGEINKQLSELSQGKPLFTFQAKLDFFNAYHATAKINLAPIHHQDTDHKFDFAGGVIEITDDFQNKLPNALSNISKAEIAMLLMPENMLIDLDKITLLEQDQSLITIDKINYHTRNLQQGKNFSDNINVTFKNFTLNPQDESLGKLNVAEGNLELAVAAKEKITSDLDWETLLMNLLSGKLSLDLNKITYQMPANLAVSIDNIHANTQAAFNDNSIEITRGLDFKKLAIRNQLLGDGESSFQVKNLDKKVIRDFIKLLIKHKITGKSLKNDPVLEKQMFNHLLTILNNTDISESINLHNDKGALKYTLKVLLNDVARAADFAKEQNQNPFQFVKELIKSADIKAELSIPATTKLAAQALCIVMVPDENCPTESHLQQARAGVQQVVAEVNRHSELSPIKVKMLQVTDDKVTMDMHMENGIATINGVTKDLEKMAKQPDANQ